MRKLKVEIGTSKSFHGYGIPRANIDACPALGADFLIHKGFVVQFNGPHGTFFHANPAAIAKFLINNRWHGFNSGEDALKIFSFWLVLTALKIMIQGLNLS